MMLTDFRIAPRGPIAIVFTRGIGHERQHARLSCPSRQIRLDFAPCAGADIPAKQDPAVDFDAENNAVGFASVAQADMSLKPARRFR